jgi:SAM-dependent methyltransferase/uncharacterized protein YbaR (Trm112 family)
MAYDRGLMPAEQRTLEWLEERFNDELKVGELVYESSSEPRNVTQEHFGNLLRQLRILRWLDRFRFESLIDIGSGFAFMPWLFRERYKCETFYCDFVHRWNLPTDLWELHKVDHAVTAKLPQLPFADGAFDVVLCSEVLEHLVRPVEALAELMRIAKRYVVFTSLEALSSGRLRRWVDHHRVDLSVPHVERNFLLLGEFHAIMGEGFHSECFEYPPDMPGNPYASEGERRRAYATLRDRETLATALSVAARVQEHVRGAMGILGVKVVPGAALDANDPGDDRERAKWLIDRAARREQLAHEALAGAGVIQKDPTRTPWYLKEPGRPVQRDLAARLRCPDCRQTLSYLDSGMACDGCGRSFTSEYGVPVLYPKEAEPGSALAEECLERLCGSDEARRTTVRRVMERLRRNETTQSDWQRKLLRRL